MEFYSRLRSSVSFSLALLLLMASAQAQVSSAPSADPYPGRCPERYGHSVPGEIYSVFTCNSVIDGFTLNNYGPNAIVPAGQNPDEIYPARDYWFNFPGRHRQEMHLLIVDWPTADGPDVRISKLYFFPRVVVPSVERIAGNLYQVTLPNQNQVFFDSKTNEVKGGAFQEMPMDLAAYRANPQLFARVNYQNLTPAETVLVRIDRKGPAPFLEGVAHVTKQCGNFECAQCDVPTKEIFLPTSSEFRFADDQSFKDYLLAKCGFNF